MEPVADPSSNKAIFNTLSCMQEAMIGQRLNQIKRLHHQLIEQ